MSEVDRTSDKPKCPLCGHRIYGGCICISAEYAVRITELESQRDGLEASLNAIDWYDGYLMPVGKIVARNIELEALTQWQPIDTAPKDEMVLFAFDEAFFGTFTKEMQIGYYDSESEEWRFWFDERKVVGSGVTHWMPLPAPPEES